jgi:hypothetical protein
MTALRWKLPKAADGSPWYSGFNEDRRSYTSHTCTPGLVSSGFGELAAGLFWPDDAKVLVMWGYYDESGEYDQTGNLLNMTVGGCFAPLDAWKTFDAQWSAALAAEGLSYFHMTDFEAWKPPFDFALPDGNRDRARHNRLLNTLLDIMLAHVDGFWGFGAVSMFDPAKPELTHELLMEDCVGGAIKNAVLEVADFYGEPLNLVFGKQKHFGEGKIRRYIEFYDFGDAKGRIKDFTMSDPKSKSPLQAADIFAYEMARAQRSGRPERYPFQRIVDGCKATNRKLIMGWGPIRSKRLNLGASSGPVRRP